jgi:hypothetical protein
MLECYGEGLVRLPSDFEKVAKYNDQLKKPCKDNGEREIIFSLYREKGYEEVEKYFKKNIGIRKYVFIFKSLVPPKLRMWMKGLLM